MTEIFCKRLTEQRKYNNMTQRDVAQKLGISQPSYIRYENGKAEPSIENLIKLAAQKVDRNVEKVGKFN